MVELILIKWCNYFDEWVLVWVYLEDGILYYMIMLIVWCKGLLFELDLVLWDNNVLEEFLDGIFYLYLEV